MTGLKCFKGNNLKKLPDDVSSQLEVPLPTWTATATIFPCFSWCGKCKKSFCWIEENLYPISSLGWTYVNNIWREFLKNTTQIISCCCVVPLAKKIARSNFYESLWFTTPLKHWENECYCAEKCRLLLYKTHHAMRSKRLASKIINFVSHEKHDSAV